ARSGSGRSGSARHPVAGSSGWMPAAPAGSRPCRRRYEKSRGSPRWCTCSWPTDGTHPHRPSRPRAAGSRATACGGRGGPPSRAGRGRVAVRGPADAPRVEELRRTPEAREAATVPAEAENVGPLDEERPMFRQELLERREVHEGGVDLYLAEVRIERRIDREVRSDAVLHVEAGAAEVAAAGVERIAGHHRIVVRAARDGIGQQLEPPRLGDVMEAYQMGEAGHKAALGLADERKQRELVLALDQAHESHAPYLDARG